MPIFHFSKKRFVISVLCTLFIVTAAGWVFTGYLVEMATHTVKQNVEDANLIISLNLTNELKRIESAAVAVAGSPLTLPVLQANNPANMEKINNILDRYNKSLDAAACYLINHDGLTLASSNRNAEDSFVGQNYTFRPYFQQAIKGGVGRHFAVGTVTGRRGFFASAPVKDKEGQIVGVVVIKKELEDIEIKLKQYIWFLLDQNGIIFLSSQPEARLKSLWPLGNEQKQKIILSKQFGPGPFEPILRKQLKDKSEVTFKGGQYLSAQVATPYEGISVILLWPTGQISMYRSFGIILTLLTFLLALSFLAVIYIFTQSNFRMESLLKESQSQALILADSESQLRARTDELESQKKVLLEKRCELESTMHKINAMSQAVNDALVMIDSQSKVLFWNQSAEKLFGYTAEEAMGMDFHGLAAPPETREKAFAGMRQFAATGKGVLFGTAIETTALNRKGETFPVEVNLSPFQVDNEWFAVGTVRDITERKKADAMKVEKEVAEEAAARADQARQEAERAQEELKAKILEIERFNRLALGREERIIDLKRQVNTLAVKAGEKPFYKEHELTGGVDDKLAVAESTVLESEQLEIVHHSLAEMLNVDQFKRLLVDFCESVGIAAAIIDLKGEVLATARWQRACTDFHRVNEKTCARCIESDTELALNLNEGKPFSVYRCKNGLIDAASPIIVEGKHIANAFVGQFFTSLPDMEFFQRQAEECGLDTEQYLEAIREAPVVDENRLESVLGFLVEMAQIVASMSMERNRARQAEVSMVKRADELKRERTAAMSLAEDADQARLEIERFKEHLELLVKERTEALKISEERSRLILGAMSEGIFGLDTGGRVTFVNPAVSAILGYAEEEILGKLMHVEVHYAYPDSTEFPRLLCPMYLSSQDGKVRTVDNEVLWHKDGSAVPVEYSTTPVWQDGQVVGTVVSFRDITKRKQAEKELKDRMEDLERFSRLTINREEKMIQLKEEINSLLEKIGGDKKYKIVE